MNDLVVYDEKEFETMQRVSKALVASGYFADAKDVAQAYVKVQAGKELGLQPVASMTGIHIVKGKPTLGANLIAALIKRHPAYNYRVVKMTDAICTIAFFEHGEPCGESTFTAADAKRAGTQNMSKFPRNMLFARAMSNGARWYCPDVFSGARIYTPDEIGAAGSYTIDGEFDMVADDEPEAEPTATDNLPQPQVKGEWSTTFVQHVLSTIDYYNAPAHVLNTVRKLELDAPTNKSEASDAYRALQAYAEKRATEKAGADVDVINGELGLPEADPITPDGAYAE